jgi:hypothetical protein
MRSRFDMLLKAACVCVGLSCVTSGYAALESRLGGLAVYDTDLNITWATNANNVGMNQFNASAWAGTLVIDGVSGWRLPEVSPVNSTVFSFDGSTDVGYNITSKNNEMAYLWYVELGNKGLVDTAGNPQSGSGLTSTGPFTNLQANGYWSASTEIGSPLFYFNMAAGSQNLGQNNDPLYALAVHSGDVAAVPEPETYVMLLAGLGILGCIGWRRRQYV